MIAEPGTLAGDKLCLEITEDLTMPDRFKKNDKVSWDTSQGTTEGEIVRKQTSRTKIKGHTVAASKDDPQYIVKSSKSGKLAAHRPEELKAKK
jgi:hypothetical protein